MLGLTVGRRKKSVSQIIKSKPCFSKCNQPSMMCLLCCETAQQCGDLEILLALFPFSGKCSDQHKCVFCGLKITLKNDVSSFILETVILHTLEH